MKNRKFRYLKVFKIVFIISFIVLSANNIYGQETKEDAIVSILFLEENDTKIIEAKVTDADGVPVEEVELYFFVKRTFSLLPIGDGFNSTDENGLVELEFPNDLPGDIEGAVTIIVQIIDNDLYNDLSMKTIKKWGIPTEIIETKENRSLWAAAANAPISLIISISGMILAIWFIILYIIFNLFKISKIKPLKYVKTIT
jgi:hypothetical protein